MGRTYLHAVGTRYMQAAVTVSMKFVYWRKIVSQPQSNTNMDNNRNCSETVCIDFTLLVTRPDD